MNPPSAQDGVGGWGRNFAHMSVAKQRSDNITDVIPRHAQMLIRASFLFHIYIVI